MTTTPSTPGADPRGQLRDALFKGLSRRQDPAPGASPAPPMNELRELALELGLEPLAVLAGPIGSGYPVHDIVAGSGLDLDRYDPHRTAVGILGVASAVLEHTHGGRWLVTEDGGVWGLPGHPPLDVAVDVVPALATALTDHARALACPGLDPAVCLAPVPAPDETASDETAADEVTVPVVPVCDAVSAVDVGLPVQSPADPGVRLEMARSLTQAADGKAASLLTAAGVLAAAGAVLTGSGSGAAGPVVTAAGLVAGTALVGALVVLLLVLSPRGGTPTAWLAGLDPQVELDRVAGIAATKHRLLRLAVGALVVAVLAGAVTVTAVLGGGAR